MATRSYVCRAHHQSWRLEARSYIPPQPRPAGPTPADPQTRRPADPQIRRPAPQTHLRSLAP
eukprot:1029258-Prorocentrum_minimum.AAC.1